MEESESATHPLQNKWTLSEQFFIDNKVDKRRGYENSFEKICVLTTVEMFWAYWKAIPAIA